MDYYTTFIKRALFITNHPEIFGVNFITLQIAIDLFIILFTYQMFWSNCLVISFDRIFVIKSFLETMSQSNRGG